MKSEAFDKTSVAFDTNSMGNYRTSIRNRNEINRKQIAFDKKSIAFDTKSNGNYRKFDKNSIGNR